MGSDTPMSGKSCLPISLLWMEFEREYPAWPWKEWGKVEADKARLEEAVHRVEARKFWEAQEQGGWDRCRGCGWKGTFKQVSEARLSSWGTGRMMFEAQCPGCGERVVRSYHPDPVVAPGLEAAVF